MTQTPHNPDPSFPREDEVEAAFERLSNASAASVQTDEALDRLRTPAWDASPVSDGIDDRPGWRSRDWQRRTGAGVLSVAAIFVLVAGIMVATGGGDDPESVQSVTATDPPTDTTLVDPEESTPVTGAPQSTPPVSTTAAPVVDEETNLGEQGWLWPSRDSFTVQPLCEPSTLVAEFVAGAIGDTDPQIELLEQTDETMVFFHRARTEGGRVLDDVGTTIVTRDLPPLSSFQAVCERPQVVVSASSDAVRLDKITADGDELLVRGGGHGFEGTIGLEVLRPDLSGEPLAAGFGQGGALGEVRDFDSTLPGIDAGVAESAIVVAQSGGAADGAIEEWSAASVFSTAHVEVDPPESTDELGPEPGTVPPGEVVPAGFAVSGVVLGDVLNMRSESDPASDIVGSIAPDFTGVIAPTGATETLDNGSVWRRVIADGVEGWVNDAFLVDLVVGPEADLEGDAESHRVALAAAAALVGRDLGAFVDLTGPDGLIVTMPGPGPDSAEPPLPSAQVKEFEPGEEFVVNSSAAQLSAAQLNAAVTGEDSTVYSWGICCESVEIQRATIADRLLTFDLGTYANRGSAFTEADRLNFDGNSVSTTYLYASNANNRAYPADWVNVTWNLDATDAGPDWLGVAVSVAPTPDGPRVVALGEGAWIP